MIESVSNSFLTTDDHLHIGKLHLTVNLKFEVFHVDAPLLPVSFGKETEQFWDRF